MLDELPQNSIASWEELFIAIPLQLFPTLKMMTPWEIIKSFKRMEGEQIHESLLRFKNLVLQLQLKVCLKTFGCNMFMDALISVTKV